MNMSALAINLRKGTRGHSVHPYDEVGRPNLPRDALHEVVMVSSQTVLILTVVCAFQFGLYVVLISNMRSQLAAHLRLAERSIGSLWAAMNFVLVPLILVAGMAIDLGHVRWVIAGGGLFTAMALLLLQSGGGVGRGTLAAILASAGLAS